MRKRPLLWQFYPLFLTITLAVLAGVGWFAITSFENFSLNRISDELSSRVHILEEQIKDKLYDGQTEMLRAACVNIGKASHTRLLIKSRQMQTVAESHPDEELGGSPYRQGLVKDALNGREVNETITDPRNGNRIRVMVLPVVRHHPSEVIAAVYAEMPIADIDEQLRQVRWQIVLAGLILSLLSAALVFWVSRGITRPIEQMRQGAQRFARGELSYKLGIPDSYELGQLAESLNSMAAQLQDRIGIIVRQSIEQQAVLGSMSEGVLAIDNSERVISMNAAFGHLLNVDPAAAVGRSLQEVVRSADLHRFVVRALRKGEPVEDVIVLHGDDEGVLQARAAALYDAHSKGIGAVVVLNDVTHFRRLEKIRRDFVANVSHELKTPIAAIKGFVETLQDGALQQPDDAQRFLAIIARQADRLNNIIDDLLSLSKIEQGDGFVDLVLEPARLMPILESAVNDCTSKAQERHIRLSLAGDQEIALPVNSQLLGQAVLNLLDNALKYSDDDSEIQLILSREADEITISVSDQGCGIPAEHLPRIFERFYRVDKARSRKLGGTGLGLAIVKHIVQAHGGWVTVKSAPGEGSAFTLHLPTTNSAT